MIEERICSCSDYVLFHGYKVYPNADVVSKKGTKIKTSKRFRKCNNNKYDLCVTLHYSGRKKKWTLHRLVAACFLGPIDGYQINHKDRDPTNNHISNLERVTQSENQRHWRESP